MSLEIPAGVQNANHVDAGGCQAVEDDVRVDQGLAVTRPNVIACIAPARIAHHILEPLLELTHVALGLRRAPALFGIVPDFIEVGLRARREDIAGHLDEAFLPRFLAMNLSKSNDVDGPLSSPSTSAARSAASFVSWSSNNRKPARTTSLAEPYRPAATCVSMKSVK